MTKKLSMTKTISILTLMTLLIGCQTLQSPVARLIIHTGLGLVTREIINDNPGAEDTVEYVAALLENRFEGGDGYDFIVKKVTDQINAEVRDPIYNLAAKSLALAALSSYRNIIENEIDELGTDELFEIRKEMATAIRLGIQTSDNYVGDELYIPPSSVPAAEIETENLRIVFD